MTIRSVFNIRDLLPAQFKAHWIYHSFIRSSWIHRLSIRSRTKAKWKRTTSIINSLFYSLSLKLNSIYCSLNYPLNSKLIQFTTYLSEIYESINKLKMKKEDKCILNKWRTILNKYNHKIMRIAHELTAMQRQHNKYHRAWKCFSQTVESLVWCPFS